jgi:hypothetical protein
VLNIFSKTGHPTNNYLSVTSNLSGQAMEVTEFTGCVSLPKYRNIFQMEMCPVW